MRPLTGGSGGAVLVTLAAALLWGLWWWPLRALAGGPAGPVASMTVIYLVGAGAALVVVAAQAWRGTAGLRAGGAAWLVSGLLFGGVLATWNLALLWGEVARVTLLFYLSPVWAVILAFVVGGRCPDRRRWAALALGLGGAGLLFGPAALAGGGLRLGAGDAMGLTSGVLFAVTLTAARHLPGRIAAVAQTALAVLVAALVTLVTGGATALAAAPPSASWMVGAAAFALLILIPGVMMILHGGNRLESEKVTLLLLLEVPVAMLSAALIAGETVAPFDLAAGALIIAAAAIEAWPTAARSAADK